MQKMILVGNLRRPCVLPKNPPTKGSEAGASAADKAATLCRANGRLAGPANDARFSRSDTPAPSLDAKTIATLTAQFALTGRELRVITKAGHSYFEVRRFDESYTVGTVADLHGVLRQIGGSYA